MAIFLVDEESGEVWHFELFSSTLHKAAKRFVKWKDFPDTPNLKIYVIDEHARSVSIYDTDEISKLIAEGE